MNQPEITVKVACSAVEINRLRHFWSRLNYNSEADMDFVLMLASVRPEIHRPYILAAYYNDELVALMVGRVEKTLMNVRIGYFTLFKLPLTQIVFVRDGYLGEWSERITKEMVEEIAKALRKGEVNRVRLCSLPIDSILHDYTKRYFHEFQRNCFCIIGEHWITSLPNNFEAFLMKKSKKRRHEFRRITKVFENQYKGKVSYQIFTKSHEVDAFCRSAEMIAKTTYQRGLDSGFFDNLENRERLDLATRKGWLRAYVVLVEDIPIAFWAGERVGDVMHLIWTGFDPSYRKYEVGTILFLKMVEDLLVHGIKEIDYGLGGAKYKERFGDQCLMEQDVDIYAPTLKGYSINLISILERVINRTGKRLSTWLKITEKVKRICLPRRGWVFQNRARRA